MVRFPGILGEVLNENVRPLHQVDLADVARDVEYAKQATENVIAGSVAAGALKQARFVSEPTQRAKCLTNGVKVGPRQFAEVYAMVRYAASVLGVNCPQVYLLQTAGPCCLGTSAQSIVILPPLVLTLLSPTELLSVIAHELTHLARGDYLVGYIVSALDSVWQAYEREEKEIPSALREDFLKWLARARAGETVCDRVGLLLCQSLAETQVALLKVSMGNAELAARVNVGEYIAEHMNLLEFHPHHGVADALFAEHPAVAARLSNMEKFYRTRYSECLQKGLVHFDGDI